MYRAAASLRALKGRANNNIARPYASSTDVATKPSSGGGILSWLTGGSKTLPSLDFTLPDVAIPPSLPDRVEPSKTQITTLSNGLKIASETSAIPTASIGLFVNSGSIYESPLLPGVSHLLERMAFKSTRNRSHFRVIREAEAIGGNLRASASREQMVYSFDALKTYVPEMVELLIDCVRNPAFLDWEVNEELKKMEEDLSSVSNNPHGLIMEAIHAAGFSGALANPLLGQASLVSSLNSAVLEEFMAEHYTAPRIVIAASGVDHEKLLSVAEPLLSDLPNYPGAKEPQSVYTGGDFRLQADTGGKTHFAIAFELPGGWQKAKNAMALTVFQMLLGGGGSFSAGGPGKGMYSRLYMNVLIPHVEVQEFTAFSNIYNHTGIFGIQATTNSNFVSEAVGIAAKELIDAATPRKITQSELDRAKISTKSAILMNLESRIIVAEDIGRQVSTYGERKPIDFFLKSVDEVTLKDIETIAQKLLSSPLTMASYGDVIHVPSYDSVKRKFTL